MSYLRRIPSLVLIALVLLATPIFVQAATSKPSESITLYAYEDIKPDRYIAAGSTSSILILVQPSISTANNESRRKFLDELKGTKRSIYLEELNSKLKTVKTYKMTHDKESYVATYSQKISVAKAKVGLLNFRIKTDWNKKMLYSKPFSVEITPSDMPNDVAASDPKQITTAPGGYQIVGDELLVDFKHGTTWTVVTTTISKAGGKVIGRIPGIDRYQIKIPAEKREDIMKALEKLPQVSNVFENEIMSTF